MRVFVTGSGFSGSGFLLDWMNEQDSVTVLPFRPFHYRHYQGLAQIEVTIVDLVAELLRSKGLGTNAAVVDEIIEILDAVCRTQTLPTYLRARNRLLRALRDPTLIGGYLEKKVISSRNPDFVSRQQPAQEAHLDLDFFSTIRERMKSESLDMNHILGLWFREKLNRNTYKKSEAVVIDKSVPGDAISFANFLEMAAPARIVFVIRDAADQIAQAYRNIDMYKSRENEKHEYRLRLPSMIEERAAINRSACEFARNHPNLFAIVRFESLVNDHQRSTKKIADWLGLELKHSSYSKLNPERSAENIGVSRTFPFITDDFVGQLQDVYREAGELAIC